MIGLVLTLDYEIYGTGVGDFDELVVDPTQRLLDLADRHGARITIMAEVAEIMALRREPGFSDVVTRIEDQLRSALASGHDVQLHLHPAWFNARHGDDGWELDFDEYALAALSPSTLSQYVATGKNYLDDLGGQVRSDYRCVAFRAGNWLIQPSASILGALTSAGLSVDSTVFKWGRGQVGPFSLDFRTAHSDLVPWPADPADINRSRPGSAVLEVPIFTRHVPAWGMVTPHRIRLQRRLRARSLADHRSPTPGAQVAGGRAVSRPRLRYPKKFDFCRLTQREMKSFLRIACSRSAHASTPAPVVAIGHTAELDDVDRLAGLFRYVADHPDITYMTLADAAI